MRALTTNEKINLRAAFARKGIVGRQLLKIDVRLSLYWWGVCYGYIPIIDSWRMLHITKQRRSKECPIRTTRL